MGEIELLSTNGDYIKIKTREVRAIQIVGLICKIVHSEGVLLEFELTQDQKDYLIANV